MSGSFADCLIFESRVSADISGNSIISIDFDDVSVN